MRGAECSPWGEAFACPARYCLPAWRHYAPALASCNSPPRAGRQRRSVSRCRRHSCWDCRPRARERVGLATSGSGDTLAGIVAGLAARGATAAHAAVWGAYLHGSAGRVLAGRIGPIGFLARELLDEIPKLMARFGTV